MATILRCGASQSVRYSVQLFLSAWSLLCSPAVLLLVLRLFHWYLGKFRVAYLLGLICYSALLVLGPLFLVSRCIVRNELVLLVGSNKILLGALLSSVAAALRFVAFLKLYFLGFILVEILGLLTAQIAQAFIWRNIWRSLRLASLLVLWTGAFLWMIWRNAQNNIDNQWSDLLLATTAAIFYAIRSVMGQQQVIKRFGTVQHFPHEQESLKAFGKRLIEDYRDEKIEDLPLEDMFEGYEILQSASLAHMFTHPMHCTAVQSLNATATVELSWLYEGAVTGCMFIPFALFELLELDVGAVTAADAMMFLAFLGMLLILLGGEHVFYYLARLNLGGKSEGLVVMRQFLLPMVLLVLASLIEPVDFLSLVLASTVYGVMLWESHHYYQRMGVFRMLSRLIGEYNALDMADLEYVQWVADHKDSQTVQELLFAILVTRVFPVPSSTYYTVDHVVIPYEPPEEEDDDDRYDRRLTPRQLAAGMVDEAGMQRDLAKLLAEMAG